MHVVSAVSCPKQKSKEHCGCAVSKKPGQASGTFTIVSPKKRAPQVRARPPVPWAAASNAAIESVPSGRKRSSHKQATSSFTSPAPQTGLMACFSHDRLAPPCTTQVQIVTTNSVSTSRSWYTLRYNWCRKHLTSKL